MSVLVDATEYADPLDPTAAPPRVRATTEQIGGRPARVVYWEENDGTRVVGARFAGGPESAAARSGVTVVVRTTSDVPSDVPMGILRSVRFLSE